MKSGPVICQSFCFKQHEMLTESVYETVCWFLGVWHLLVDLLDVFMRRIMMHTSVCFSLQSVLHPISFHIRLFV